MKTVAALLLMTAGAVAQEQSFTFAPLPPALLTLAPGVAFTPDAITLGSSVVTVRPEGLACIKDGERVMIIHEDGKPLAIECRTPGPGNAG